MSAAESRMPARIWAENTPDYGAWFDYRKDIDDVRYIRADLVEPLVEALRRADQFITNGIELGFIRMPDPDCPDTAHRTPGLIRAALSSWEAGQ